eukprot:1440284-Prymnesium_polylepis.1
MQQCMLSECTPERANLTIPSHVALVDAGVGRRSCGGEQSVAKSATAPPLHPTLPRKIAI